MRYGLSWWIRTARRRILAAFSFPSGSVADFSQNCVCVVSNDGSYRYVQFFSVSFVVSEKILHDFSQVSSVYIKLKVQ